MSIGVEVGLVVVGELVGSVPFKTVAVCSAVGLAVCPFGLDVDGLPDG